ncbi:MAG: hypothetical protein JWM73_2614 [Solirubrobacterales bacterium]|nr:hypothetical protein [Solirubrobacterales bacterium]
MLLRPGRDEDETICVGQASHAWISGQLARAWGAVGEPRAAVELGAEQHDIGWSDWDRAPDLNPGTGLPFAFTEVPDETRFAVWEPAALRLQSQSLYAALLVSLHGSSLRFGLDQRELQDDWIARLGADRGVLDRHRRQLLQWDALSLALCLRWDPFARDGLTLERIEDETFSLRPWPFAGAGPVVVGCEGRVLRGRFAKAAELHAALAAAPVVALRFTLTA